MSNPAQPEMVRSDAEVPTDLLAGLLIEQSSKREDAGALPAKVWAVMAFTSLLTFTTLTTGYQLLFSHSLFA